MASTEYEQGVEDWRTKGRMDPEKVASSDYRRGAQDQRTGQVDDELRHLSAPVESAGKEFLL